MVLDEVIALTVLIFVCKIQRFREKSCTELIPVRVVRLCCQEDG